MELVRGVVKVMEEGMLDTFDDEAEKPVSAAFGAPSTLNDSNTYSSFQERYGVEESQRNESNSEKENTANANFIHTHIQTLSNTSTTEDYETSSGRGKPPIAPITIPETTTLSSANFNFTTRPLLSPRRHSIDSTSPLLLSSVPVNPDEDYKPIMESISHEAIEEMVDQVFVLAGVDASERDFLEFEEFQNVVHKDVNLLAWIEALGSVF